MIYLYFSIWSVNVLCEKRADYYQLSKFVKYIINLFNNLTDPTLFEAWHLLFRDYRVTHVLSHHLFANTIIDMELSLLEPGFQFLPWEGKSWWARFGPWIYSPIWYCFLLHIGFVNRYFYSIHFNFIHFKVV